MRKSPFAKHCLWGQLQQDTQPLKEAWPIGEPLVGRLGVCLLVRGGTLPGGQLFGGPRVDLLEGHRVDNAADHEGDWQEDRDVFHDLGHPMDCHCLHQAGLPVRLQALLAIIAVAAGDYPGTAKANCPAGLCFLFRCLVGVYM